MHKVNLTPEGRLLVQSFDSASRSSNSFEDITDVAHHYLFEQIELPSDITVRSIFLLLNHNSTLRNIYPKAPKNLVLQCGDVRREFILDQG